MIPLWRKLIYALLWDELAVRRWVRGVVMWGGGAAVQVAAVGWDVARHWTVGEWAGRLAIAGILGLGGMINLGERNPKADVS